MEWAEKIQVIEGELGIENDRGRLAKLLGVRPGVISDIKNGKAKNPGSNIALLLINKLGINPKWLEIGDMPIILEGLINYPFDKQKGASKSLYINRIDSKKSLRSDPNGGTIEADPEEGSPPGSADNAAEERGMAAVVERTKAVRSRIAGEIPIIYAEDERLEKGIVIPFLEDQAISAGPGADLDEGDNPTRYIRAPEYLARYPDLAMLPVRGDSMDPTLHDGDLVVCDGGGWDGDGIYVIKSEEKAFVKRVLFTPDGYQVISDNKMYPTYGARNENLAIVGKVRAAVIMMPGRIGGV
jgi:phage repressor protein C with HTH and peptisase S24 domain